MAKTTKQVVFDQDAQAIVAAAIHALYAIRRLAILTADELPYQCGDAATFCAAIREMSEAHGKALDGCLPENRIGSFDKEFIDHEAAGTA
jgi:hypothetical protein